MWRPSAACYTAAVDVEADQLATLRRELQVVQAMTPSEGNAPGQKACAALANVTNDELKVIRSALKQASRLSAMGQRLWRREAPATTAELQAFWGIPGVVDAVALARAYKGLALTFHGDKIEQLLEKAAVPAAQGKEVLSVFGILQTLYEKHLKQIRGIADPASPQEISGVRASVVDLGDDGRVGIQVSCWACPTDAPTEYDDAETVVQVEIPAFFEDDLELVRMELQGNGRLLATLDSDTYPWLFTPELVQHQDYVTMRLKRWSTTGLSSEDREVHVVVAATMPDDNHDDEVWDVEDPDENEADDQWINDWRAHYQEVRQQPQHGNGKRGRRGGAKKKKNRRGDWRKAQQQNWLEEQLRQLTQRLARLTLEIEADSSWRRQRRSYWNDRRVGDDRSRRTGQTYSSDRHKKDRYKEKHCEYERDEDRVGRSKHTRHSMRR